MLELGHVTTFDIGKRRVGVDQSVVDKVFQREKMICLPFFF
jgi:hypothetical protein